MTVIAMTREIGCLGTEVAAGVAKRLDLERVARRELGPPNCSRHWQGV